jgi:hypothetical protein
MLRPYTTEVKQIDVGGVEFKPHDLGDDRAYRVAKDRLGQDAAAGRSKPRPYKNYVKTSR